MVRKKKMDKAEEATATLARNLVSSCENISKIHLTRYKTLD